MTENTTPRPDDRSDDGIAYDERLTSLQDASAALAPFDSTTPLDLWLVARWLLDGTPPYHLDPPAPVAEGGGTWQTPPPVDDAPLHGVAPRGGFGYGTV